MARPATKRLVFDILVESVDLTKLAALDIEDAYAEIGSAIREIISARHISLPPDQEERLIGEVSRELLGKGRFEALATLSPIPVAVQSIDPRPVWLWLGALPLLAAMTFVMMKVHA